MESEVRRAITRIVFIRDRVDDGNCRTHPLHHREKIHSLPVVDKKIQHYSNNLILP